MSHEAASDGVRTPTELLELSFLAYTQTVIALSKVSGEAVGVPPIPGGTHIEFLRANVERLERTKEFAKLVKAVQEEFAPAESDLLVLWEPRVGNFFRLSGFYEEAITGRDLDLPRYMNLFSASFMNKTRVTLYAPLETLSFSEDKMDFGDFKIQKHTKGDLDSIFRQRICKYYYPRAVLDTAVLSEYWFIVCDDELAGDEEEGWESIGPLGQLSVSFSVFREPLKNAVRRLLLYPWATSSGHPSQSLTRKGAEWWEGTPRFSIPFTLLASDSLTARPQPAPDTSALSMTPITDPEDGTVVAWQPWIGWVEDINGSEPFSAFIKQIDTSLRAAGSKDREWTFMNTALNFLEKAFFRTDIEQLLWHITVIEALLGEKVESGLTNLLKSRVGEILGVNESEKKAIKKNFDELYALRSDLVHGNANIGERQIFLGQLDKAREMARALCVWMINFLGCVRNSLPAETELPSRDTLLSLIDMDEKSRLDAIQVLPSLPKGFPNVGAW